MDRLETFFLSKYIKAPKRNLFRFSFVFMVLGIVLSVGILSAGLNLFEGYESTLRTLLLDSFAHVSIQASGGGYMSRQQSNDLIRSLDSRPELVSAIPSIQYSLMAMANDKIRSARLRAYEFDSGFPYEKYIEDYPGSLAPQEVIVGHYLARDLGLELGDEITLNYPQLDRISPLGMMSGSQSFRIAALYRSGYYENDRSIVLCRMDDAESFLLLSDSISKIELRLRNAEHASNYAREYSQLLGADYVSIPWDLYAHSLLRLVEMEKWLIFIVFSFLVLIAGFNVVSAVSTIIIDKGNEIAVLKTLGASPRSIKRIFALRVGLAAILAVVLGQIFGAFLSWVVEKQSFYRLKGDVYFIDTLGANITVFNLTAVFVVASALIALCIYLPLKQIDRVQIISLFRNQG
jgi:lipoprotein-releasing system permease protein